MSEVLIKVEVISKKFCCSLKKSLWYGVRDISAEIVGGRQGCAQLRKDEFWALKDISFEVKRGECLALVGQNGAGKTTMLKLLSGLIKPDHGTIEIAGRVGALIALGAGFNPILTGRENIYINGALLGFTRKEIGSKLEEIISFAGIGKFIDAPVQNYSSGMYVRLGFAVAAALSPDVLLLDEILAVGDAAFRNKCYHRIGQISKRAAVIFVSHDVEQISRICDRALVLAQGQVRHSGSVSEGIAVYEKLSEERQDMTDSFLSTHHPITAFRVEFESTRLVSGRPLQICVCVHSLAPVGEFLFRMTLYNMAGAIAAECSVTQDQHSARLPGGESSWEIIFASIPLRNGRYRVGFNLFDEDGALLVWCYKQYTIEVVDAFPGANSDCQLLLKAWRPCTQLALVPNSGSELS